MEKRFKVIAIHPDTGGCDLNCSFCYKKVKIPAGKKLFKDEQFWIDIVPFLATLTDQVAVGANGEPFMNIPFVQRISKVCTDNGITCNVTTNGRKLMAMSECMLKQSLMNVKVISISYDKEKITGLSDYKKFKELVDRIKRNSKCEVGCNLLMDTELFKDSGRGFIELVSRLFKDARVDRVFALHPKNFYLGDITKQKFLFAYLTNKFDKFFADDLTREILAQGYNNWKQQCHYGENIISIDEYGNICGCSFDQPKDSLFTINKPKDLEIFNSFKIGKRYECPYLVKPK